ncbi:hypothetical protein F4811DRAFT_221921 [Daldinia bambusicola]|nr:hypothetical protein F4811DRAFT_221921 [Daldinia bambusicola]
MYCPPEQTPKVQSLKRRNQTSLWNWNLGKIPNQNQKLAIIPSSLLVHSYSSIFLPSRDTPHLQGRACLFYFLFFFSFLFLSINFKFRSINQIGQSNFNSRVKIGQFNEQKPYRPQCVLLAVASRSNSTTTRHQVINPHYPFSRIRNQYPSSIETSTFHNHHNHHNHPFPPRTRQPFFA